MVPLRLSLPAHAGAAGSQSWWWWAFATLHCTPPLARCHVHRFPLAVPVSVLTEDGRPRPLNADDQKQVRDGCGRAERCEDAQVMNQKKRARWLQLWQQIVDGPQLCC